MFFILSKILGFLLFPINTVFILSIIWFLSSYQNRLKHLSKKLGIITLTFWLVIGYESIPSCLLSNLENAYPKYQEHYKNLDGIIILGGGTGSGLASKERNEALLNNAAERLTEATKVFHQNPDIKIIFSGSSGFINPKGWLEFKIAKRFFNEQGIPPESISYDTLSRNTFENIREVKELLSSKQFEKTKKIGLITSAFHMYRSMAVVKKILPELNIVPIPVDFRTPISNDWLLYSHISANLKWHMLLHEHVGYWIYKLTGKI